jgi:hypothetical protein
MSMTLRNFFIFPAQVRDMGDFGLKYGLFFTPQEEPNFNTDPCISDQGCNFRKNSRWPSSYLEQNRQIGWRVYSVTCKKGASWSCIQVQHVLCPSGSCYQERIRVATNQVFKRFKRSYVSCKTRTLLPRDILKNTFDIRGLETRAYAKGWPWTP